VKRSLITLALLLSAFLLGWYSHLFITADPHAGRQCRYVEAARRGDIREVERLFPGATLIDAEPGYANGAVSGFPALLEAAGAGEPETVAWLLAHGADPNRQTSDSWPLAAAERRVTQATKTAAILKQHGAKHLYPTYPK
jgi:hypothetical protein